jgi:hypothetical protein
VRANTCPVFSGDDALGLPSAAPSDYRDRQCALRRADGLDRRVVVIGG